LVLPNWGRGRTIVPRPAIRAQNGNRQAGLPASRSIELDHYDIAEAMGAKVTYSLMSIDEFQRQIADKY
jgi:hypothetical protein